MLVCIGEILVDVFIEDNKETILPGGAPFNVATNATNYTKDVYFVGAVGKDSNGELLIKTAKAKNFRKVDIKVLDGKKTTRAIVTLIDGERHFKFDRNNGADYHLSLDDVDFSIIKKDDIVHIGSLLLSYPEGVSFYNSLVNKIRTIEGVKISFDINYRDDIFTSPKEAKKVFINALKQADILKFSIDELLLLADCANFEVALSKLVNKNQTAVITLGKDGSFLYYKGQLYKSSSIPLKPVDTTGAGDAFYSYFLSSVVNHPDFLDKKDLIQKYLFRSNVVGGIATLKKGAINVTPTEQEIDDYIAKL